MVIVQCQPDLLEIVSALAAPCRFARLLHCGYKQGHWDGSAEQEPPHPGDDQAHDQKNRLFAPPCLAALLWRIIMNADAAVRTLGNVVGNLFSTCRTRFHESPFQISKPSPAPACHSTGVRPGMPVRRPGSPATMHSSVK